jgi:hypothetical protein
VIDPLDKEGGGEESHTGTEGEEGSPASCISKNGDLASNGGSPLVQFAGRSSSWYIPDGMKRRGYGTPVHRNEVLLALATPIVSLKGVSTTVTRACLPKGRWAYS